MKPLTRAVAEELYAQVFEVCHSPCHEDGRTLNLGSSDTVATYFTIRTRFGDLEVSIVRSKFSHLMNSIGLRFLSHEVPSVGVDSADFSPVSRKWNVPIDLARPYDSVDVLERRLKWAQGEAVQAEMFQAVG